MTLFSPLPLAAACALLVAITAPAFAGLDTTGMQQRHRRLNDAAAGVAAAPVAAAPTSIGLYVGPDRDVAPPMLTDPIDGGLGLSFSQQLLSNEHGAVRIGFVARASDESLRLEGTSASARTGPGEAYASYEKRHWGPGWFGSLIIDSAAPAMPALGWRADQPGWGADLFMAGLSGHRQPKDPWLVGMRLDWRPWRRLNIGLSRTLQWGGEGRDESLRSFGRALAGRDNSGEEGLDSNNEPGNQLAGVDLRLDLGGESAAGGLYVQVIGEDEANLQPSKRMFLAGTDLAIRRQGASLRAIVEWADTRAGSLNGRIRPGVAYRHHIYQQGYSQRGVPIGHAAGGDAQIGSVGALVDRGALFGAVAFHHGKAREASQLFSVNDKLQGLDASASLQLNAQTSVGLSAHHWRIGDGRDRWAQLWVRHSWP